MPAPQRRAPWEGGEGGERGHAAAWCRWRGARAGTHLVRRGGATHDRCRARVVHVMCTCPRSLSSLRMPMMPASLAFNRLVQVQTTVKHNVRDDSQHTSFEAFHSHHDASVSAHVHVAHMRVAVRHAEQEAWIGSHFRKHGDCRRRLVAWASLLVSAPMLLPLSAHAWCEVTM